MSSGQGIPDEFRIDFSRRKRDLVNQAMSRMLSQHWNSPVLKDFIATYIRHGPQWMYNEIIKQQEENTLYMATGENLEIIGRIVGRGRIAYEYDDSQWFCADRPNQGTDSSPVWVQGAPLAAYSPMGDAEYRRQILARIACNHNKFSSIPELQYLVEFVTGEKVSWRTIGPMEAELVVNANISNTVMHLLTRSRTTTECDDIFYVPYPATLRVSRAVYVPDRAFHADRMGGQQCDTAPCAVGIPLV